MVDRLRMAGVDASMPCPSADQSREAHVDAAPEAWRSIKRDDLVAELDKRVRS